MDKDQKGLQFLNFFDTWRESLKIIFTWRDIFLRLVLTFILPFSLIYLIRPKTSHLLLDHSMTTVHSSVFIFSITFTASLSEWVEYVVVIQVAYVVSTSILTYTVGCIYSSKKVTFTAIISIAPKVWKRLMMTFIGFFALVFAFSLFFLFMALLICLVLISRAWMVHDWTDSVLSCLDATIYVLYLMGLAYLYVVWQLSNVVSVLEESYGFEALRRGSKLVKGKMVISLSLPLVVNLLMIGTQKLYINLNAGVFAKVGFGVVCLVVLCVLILLGQVAQTLLYLVCKSYHNECIDKIALARHLEVCHSEGYFYRIQEAYNYYVDVV